MESNEREEQMQQQLEAERAMAVSFSDLRADGVMVALLPV